MIDTFSTSRNRIKTFVLLVVCGLSAIASVVVGIDDNPPGVLLALLAAIAYILAFSLPWRTTRKFIFLLLRGRLRANNVLDTAYSEEEILAAVQRSIFDEEFRHQCQACSNPYGAGNAGPTIAEVLATIPLDSRLLQKKMTY